jgi:hypothetical protein
MKSQAARSHAGPPSGGKKEQGRLDEVSVRRPTNFCRSGQEELLKDLETLRPIALFCRLASLVGHQGISPASSFL